MDQAHRVVSRTFWRLQGIYTITRAFEAGAFTKAVAGLNSPDLIYRRKALLVRSALQI